MKALWAAALALIFMVSVSVLLAHFQQSRAMEIEDEQANGLEVTKEVNTLSAAPGDTLAYTITIVDIDDPEGTFWLTDTLPSELNCITDSLNGDAGIGVSFGVENDVITWTGELPGNGYTLQLNFSTEISSDLECTTIVNTAQITASGELTSVKSEATSVMGEVGTLSINKSVTSQDMVEPGDILTYTIDIKDIGEYPSKDVWLTDTLPSELILITESLTTTLGDIGLNNGVITWTGYMYGRGYGGVISYSAQITPAFTGDWITNVVTVTAPGQFLTRTAGARVYRPAGNLEASKSVYPSYAPLGDNLTYNIYITNTGDAPVETAWVTDELPSEVSYVSGSATTGELGEASGVITWSGNLGISGTLQTPPAATTLTITVQIATDLTDNILFTNTAQITGTGELLQPQASAKAMAHFDYYFPLIFLNYPPIPDLDPIPAPVDHAYNVSWGGIEIPIDNYVLQQARTSGFDAIEQEWTPAQEYQNVSGVYCSYYYRVRADKASDWGVGPWSTAELAEPDPPDPPTLDPIPEPEDRTYTISWSEVTLDGEVEYVLQESNVVNFSSITNEWKMTSASKSIQKGAESGMYYYRVRADDDDCWGVGPWSNIQSVEVPLPEYFDNFTDDNSGWPQDKGLIYTDSSGDQHYWRRGYKEEQGEYRIKIDQGGPQSWFQQPDALAPYRPPSDKYCVETRVRFEDGNYWANMGLVIGANDDNDDIYALCLSRGPDEESSLGWFLMRNAEYDFPRGGCSRPTYKIEGSDRQGTSHNGWNKLQVSVDGDRVDVFIGGYYKGTFTLEGLRSKTRVGVIGGDYELTPIDVRFDYFRVIPDSACN